MDKKPNPNHALCLGCYLAPYQKCDHRFVLTVRKLNMAKKLTMKVLQFFNKDGEDCF